VKLRARLLTLIAVLVSAALAASFWVIGSAVRVQTLADLERSLRVAERVWNSLSQSQAQGLVVSATSMAGEAGFVTVLRGTDPATLLDYVQEVQLRNTALDLVLVCDHRGQVRVRTDGLQASRIAHDPLLTAALEGQVVAAFWSCPSGLYMAAGAPIYRQGDVVEGVLLLGTRLDQDFVAHLARDTATQVALIPEQGPGYSTEAGLTAQSSADRKTLSTPLADFRGRRLGQLVLARDLDAALSYLKEVTWQLIGLGVGVLGLAFVISLPWVGRMTNPILQLEKSQAKMDAIFEANLDGLIALDQAGRIGTANPAAAACLGQSLQSLTGRSLEELIPSEVFSQLIAVPPSSGQLVQRCEWFREGRWFQLTRTFVASQHLEVGSVLVTRDCSHQPRQQQDEKSLLARLQRFVQQRPTGPDHWPRWERDGHNLLLLAGAPAPDSAPVEDLNAELAALLSEFHISGSVGPNLVAVDLQPSRLRLLLLNLLDSQSIEIHNEGGGCWLRARGLVLSDGEREAVEALLLEVEGRLERRDGDCLIWLPARLC
jgi:PAS domain S-box-containing protein